MCSQIPAIAPEGFLDRKAPLPSNRGAKQARAESEQFDNATY